MSFKLSIVLLLFFNYSFSQNSYDFVPPHSKINIDSFTVILKKNRDNYIASQNKEDAAILKEYKKTYDDQIKDLTSLCNGKYVFWDDTMAHYLNSIVSKIQNATPFIKRNTILLLTKTLIPNAASWGDGIIVINTGLLTKYETEGDLAYVICHELAHDYLDHLYKAQKTNYIISKQTNFKKKYRKARRARYQSASKTDDVLEEYLTAVNAFSRKDELQADSLGALLLLNAGYTHKNAIHCLQILEHADDAFFTDTLDIKKLFSGNDYTFNNKWLQKEDLTNQKIYHATLNDSLNTHPECEQRIKTLVSEFKIDTNSLISNKTTDIDFISQKALFEDMTFSFEKKNYLLSLYHGLQLLQKHPNNTYAAYIVCGSLYHIQYALTKHRFSFYVPLTHPDFDADLNALIAFLNNLSSEDYSKLIKQFYHVHLGNKTETPYLTKAKFYCNALNYNDTELTKQIETLQKEKKTTTFADILEEITYGKK